MPLDDRQTEEQRLAAASEDERASRASVLFYHREGVQVVPLPPGGEVTVGRLPPADVVIRDRRLSRRHARFELRDGEIWVEDLGSTNGTWVNGRRAKRCRLKPGDEVTIGTVVVSAHVLASRGMQQGLESHDRFLSQLEIETVRARTFGRSLGLVMVRAARRQQTHLSRWWPWLRGLLRPVDLLAVYGGDIVEILLPEATREETEQLARSLVSGRRPRSTESESESDPALLCGYALFPEAGSSADELIAVTRRAALAADAAHPVRGAPGQGVQVWRSEPPSSGEPAPQRLSHSAVMARVYQQIERLARSAIPVLICGETGTGKEVVARAIHERGPRRGKPMRCINSAAIPDQLIESLLFGHERGAFTGANQAVAGAFEAANGGTVLLDEIGEMPPAAQAALLRVLETKRVTRIGSNREIEVDVRILAATHRDLEEMCEAGTFRRDLLYRLNSVVLQIPPLRERIDEIPHLAEQFMREARAANASPVRDIDSAAMACLRRYHWPGNVRELRNEIERAVVIAEGDTILCEDLSERIRTLGVRGKPRHTVAFAPGDGAGHGGAGAAAGPLAAQATTAYATSVAGRPLGMGEEEATSVGDIVDDSFDPDHAVIDEAPPSGPDDAGDDLFFETTVPIERQATDFRQLIREFEAALITQALSATGWNQTNAARRLDMPLRTLVYKIKILGIQQGRERPGRTAAEALQAVRQAIADGLGDFRSAVQRYETELLRAALIEANWNKAEVCRRLGIPARTLANKIIAYELEDSSRKPRRG